MCKRVKSLDLFGKGSDKGGKRHWCKLCVSEYNRAKPPVGKNVRSLWNKIHRDSCKKRYGISAATIGRHGLKLSLFVYDRAGRKCEKCGEENDLVIHHKDGKGRNLYNKSQPMNNSFDNLQILCRSCHSSIHGKEGAEKRWRQNGRDKERNQCVRREVGKAGGESRRQS